MHRRNGPARYLIERPFAASRSDEFLSKRFDDGQGHRDVAVDVAGEGRFGDSKALRDRLLANASSSEGMTDSSEILACHERKIGLTCAEVKKDFLHVTKDHLTCLAVLTWEDLRGQIRGLKSHGQQKLMALRLGVTEGQISKFLHGRDAPDFDQGCGMAEIVGLRIEVRPEPLAIAEEAAPYGTKVTISEIVAEVLRQQRIPEKPPPRSRGKSGEHKRAERR